MVGQLTERDEQIAAWTARRGPVTVAQISRRFAIGRVIAYRRVRVLREQGYLTRVPQAHHRPHVLLASDLAADLARMPRGPGPALPSHRIPAHLAAVDAALEHELAGVPVLGRIELTQHPGLDALLPAGAEGVLVPDQMVLAESPLVIYAPAGTLVDLLPDDLARAAWPTGTRGQLLIDLDIRAPANPPDVLRTVHIDLSAAGTFETP